ncbi:copper chaperone PCu(A)C [Allorhizobium sp. BGMRC 0089]|uniref:copper chaperone PCu(A)C n=1 Tax=Allorhizobium sonneratiae TaxID=2934936 RepID=UPI0020343C53|nr:copper chaperone PCu(A)C [Allorhizobium sonneratiae]MCM2292979.1 copper chaperone PCu(A)C [Allorhizobium sonneratiae]
MRLYHIAPVVAAILTLPVSSMAASATTAKPGDAMKTMPMDMTQDKSAAAPMPSDEKAMDSVQAGALMLTNGYIRAMLPGQPVGGGYLTIKNDGKTPDRLLSVESPAAGMVELHEMTMQNNIMKMRRIAGGIEIKPGEMLMMKPGGYHLMFMKVNKPFADGDLVPVTLTFDKAGSVQVFMPVVSAKGKSHP